MLSFQFDPARGSFRQTPELCEWVGHTLDELSGFEFAKVLPPATLQFMPRVFDGFRAGGAFETPALYPFRDGTIVPGRETWTPPERGQRVWTCNFEPCADVDRLVEGSCQVTRQGSDSPPPHGAAGIPTTSREEARMSAVPMIADPSVPTFAAYAEAWLVRHAMDVRPRTAQLYRLVLNRYLLPIVGEVPVNLLTRTYANAVVSSLASRKLSVATIKSALGVLSAVAHDAIGEGLLEKSPTFGMKFKRQAKVRAIYNADQLELFLECAERADKQLAPVLALCAKAGLRVGEAMGLKRGDVDLAARTIRVERTRLQSGETGPTKSGRVRVVDLCDSLVAMLRPVVDKADPWLFEGRRGHGPISYGYVRSTMREAARMANLVPLAPHALRHGWASIMLKRGASMQWVQRQLGHASIVLSVDLYGSHLPLDRAAQLDGW